MRKGNPIKKVALGLMISISLTSFEPAFAAGSDVDIISHTPLTMELKNTELVDAIDAVSYMSGTPIVVNGNLKGTVTARFSNMQFTEIMDMLATNFDFNWIVKDGVVLVSAAETMTTVKTFPVKYTDLEILQKKIGTFIDSKNIAINVENNTITIDSTTPALVKAEKLIKNDDIPARQINIQAYIIEMTRSNAELLGFKTTWNKYDSSVEGWKFSYATTVDAENVLNMGKILARPSVVTMNGRPASINIVDKVPILTQTVNSSGTTETTVDYKDVGIILNALPRVNDDDGSFITVKVKPSVSAITKYVSNSDTMAPQISTREAETLVRVKSGESIIIGGLIKDDERERITAIPYLSKLPIIGNIFKHRDTTIEKTELFIFLTPTVLDLDNDNVAMMKSMEDKYKITEKKTEPKKQVKKVKEVAKKTKAATPVPATGAQTERRNL